jgi:signal transduction histidine kinase
MDFNGPYPAPIVHFQELPRASEGIAHDRPSPDRPIHDDLETAYSRIREEAPLEARVECRMVIQGKSRALRPLIRDEAYRIGREALLNAFRHSKAGRVEVDLEYAPRQFRIAVRDNGTGITAESFRAGRGGHKGLSGMRDLAERMGAKLKLLSRAAAGTEVELSIPGHIAFASQIHVRRLGSAQV